MPLAMVPRSALLRLHPQYPPPKTAHFAQHATTKLIHIAMPVRLLEKLSVMELADIEVKMLSRGELDIRQTHLSSLLG